MKVERPECRQARCQHEPSWAEQLEINKAAEAQAAVAQEQAQRNEKEWQRVKDEEARQ